MIREILTLNNSIIWPWDILIFIGGCHLKHTFSMSILILHPMIKLNERDVNRVHKVVGASWETRGFNEKNDPIQKIG